MSSFILFCSASLPRERQQTIAFEMSVAGLIADGMMDFGNLLAMPILTSLDDPQRWIVEFIRAATEGCLLMFDDALKQYSKEAIVRL